MQFRELLLRTRGESWKAPERLLCLDPGETTGFAVFENGELTVADQIRTVDSWEVIYQLFQDVKPTHVIFENYRVYQHKLERHSNSEVYTLRLIGVIEFLCDVLFRVQRFDQMASVAKGFADDKKLKMFGYYKEGLRHGRDAIRHGVYTLLFNKDLK